MNRETLFRGKRVDNGDWVVGDLIHRQIWSSSLTIIRVSDDGFEHYEEYEVKPETVGEFTNLTDKNGNKIFEGDIVKVGRKLTINIGYSYPKLIETSAPTKIFVVIYSVELGCFCFSEKYNTDYETITSDCEIIGNIYDKKEKE